MTVRDDREEIRLVLGKINDAWLKGRPEDLRAVLDRCFHDDIVIKGPGFQAMGRGKEACVKSYADFERQARVRSCQLSEPEIDHAGDTAVATYSWEMTYELDGHEYHESGHDLFVLTRIQGRWQAVWRAMLPAQAGDAV
jgi:ketosteroid isomerase-like protein